ncbi:MAG: ribosome-binding factor A [bacterium]
MNLRLEKFSSMVKKQLAPILLEYQMPGSSISVNGVKISPDLKIAHIYVSVWGSDAETVFELIQKNRGEISKALAGKIKSKFSPSLSFHLDSGQADSELIEDLLKK